MAPLPPSTPGPLNPFESTFALFKALRDEIHEVKDEVRELRIARDTRYDKLELDVDTLRSCTAKHFEKVESALEAERQARSVRLDQLVSRTDELLTANRVRADQLDAQVKAEMNIRFEQTQSLERKIRTEVSQLRAHLERTSSELDNHKRKVESDTTNDRQQHTELRQDVEKLAVLLSDSSLTRDPFNQLGVRPTTPTSTGTSLGTTAHGNSLPPLLSSNARITTRPVLRSEGSAR
uniref:NUDE domain-containing protein n=1 Tax=Pyrodinium bahamense TaxID=73915 RepID=A0A7S0AGG7_9DINO